MMGAMHFVVEKDIAVPPEHAFDTMADARNEPRWNSQVASSELVGDGPIGAGSRFRTVNRRRRYDATITTYERPDRLAFEVTGRVMDITASFSFGAGGERTLYRGEFDMRPKGSLKLFFGLIRGTVSKDLDKQSESF